ncbi:arginyltransferase [Croceicoccus gelatinilyticus]|uniref:arginyltransferase n=1 Tax=Croceicoccus gelatinilyticus TaxID=2835536 RepID=UPI001BCFDA78|nr:arginyltransferase [Croceicoccus gelatinilyticus]
MTAPVRFPRFYVTAPAPCPYLAGRQERKVFTELGGPDADALNDALGRIGFRRSQTVAYRPSCAGCNACVSVRVVASEFKASKSQARTLKANSDLVATACRPWSTVEQYELLQKYLASRHPGGGMSAMDEMDYADMVEQTPVTSYIVEYREPSDGDTPGRLVGACLTDRQNDGLSMIYSFYDPQHENRSGLGNYIILDHIRRSAAAGLAYVYLGYWIEGSSRMQYKIRFRPLERLGADGWERFDADRQSSLIAGVFASPGESREGEGLSKDGIVDQRSLKNSDAVPQD